MSDSTAGQGGRRTLAIASLGSVGRDVAELIQGDLAAFYRLTAASANREQRARAFVADFADPVDILPVGALCDRADIILECAPSEIFLDIAAPVVASGKTLIVLSAGALLDHWHLVEEASSSGAQIMVPSGALLGLDAVQGVAEGAIHSVEMVTRKPLQGLYGAPFITKNAIDLAQIHEPRRLFKGTAREAITGFPANLNVAVALSLAGVGPDRTNLEIWADPGIERNTHHIVVDADSARLEFSIANVPSSNPKTGRLTALSVVALLRKLASPLRIGT